MNINSINDIFSAAQKAARANETEEKESFSNILSDAVDYIEETEAESDAASQALLTGESDDIHTALIAAQKAEIAVSYAVQIRNKMIEAYNDIMNMQV
jgi:flagellar hook-basal body complex protein FliE